MAATHKPGRQSLWKPAIRPPASDFQIPGCEKINVWCLGHVVRGIL